ncbi:Uu.00g140190.m01.CDS01 [Anthostomella pinea]|uniref:Uu.00g140190.m01.CDS01 n=1 Tax=Anthostomella pinea TaxID=933095 RepID=A0AAI8VQ14_9PEZI|nr:Uu.00g140190.m01.CDS01 [Anthostomella pinea]
MFAGSSTTLGAAVPSPIGRPQLSTVNKYDRKYGRYDFNRFDHLVSQHASLGGASLGKIHVDCRFLFKKSKWGMLEAQHQAGIIYLDLTFNQPGDCRLKNATVQVTLDDEDEVLMHQFPGSKPESPVHIVKYGPRHMTGEPRYEQVTTRKSFMPSIEVGPFGGAGGVGRESHKTVVRECHWAFESHLKTGTRKNRNHNWAYKVLQWHLTENELKDQSIHSNVVHTAFSFVHSSQPIFMRVDVSGKLENARSDLSHQMKNKIRKLRFPSTPQNARYATTLINFAGQDRFTTPLDGLVQSLELSMEKENMNSPVEIRRGERTRLYKDGPQAAPQQTAPLEETIQSSGEQEDTILADLSMLSSTWLMSTPMSTHGSIQEEDPYEELPVAPVPSPDISRAQHAGTSVSKSPHTNDRIDQKTSNSTERSSEDTVDKDLDPTSSLNELQRHLPNGQLNFETLVLFTRLWILQAFAMVFTSWGRKESTGASKDEVNAPSTESSA